MLKARVPDLGSRSAPDPEGSSESKQAQSGNPAGGSSDVNANSSLARDSDYHELSEEDFDIGTRHYDTVQDDQDVDMSEGDSEIFDGLNGSFYGNEDLESSTAHDSGTDV